MTSEGKGAPRDTLIPDAPGETVPRADRDASNVYRRRIRLRAGAGFATGELEDNFHHFAARIEHDGRRVRGVQGKAVRFPWTTCPGAVDPLAVLVGRELTRDLSRMSAEADVRAQCTHLFDVATLAIAMAASERVECIYDAAVPEPRDGKLSVTLQRNGERLLEWEVDSFRIVSAGPFAGCMLVGGDFGSAVRGLEDIDLQEAALVLRRAIAISMARTFDMDRVTDPRAFGRAVGARCHTFSPAHEANARRIVGADRDFTDRPDALLGGDSE